MRYARLGRIITISQLMIGVISGYIYFAPVMIGNKQQVVLSQLKQHLIIAIRIIDINLFIFRADIMIYHT